MSTTTAVVLAIFGCTGFWELVKYIIQVRSTKRSASDEALLAILHEMIYPMLEIVVTRPGEVVGYNEMDRIRQLYEPYKRLGGNGTVEARYEIAETYKRIPDEVV